MNKIDQLKNATKQIEDEMDGCVYEVDEFSPIIIATAKKYNNISWKELADYFNEFGFNIERLKEQHASDIGVPYSVLFHE